FVIYQSVPDLYAAPGPTTVAATQVNIHAPFVISRPFTVAQLSYAVGVSFVVTNGDPFLQETTFALFPDINGSPEDVFYRSEPIAGPTFVHTPYGTTIVSYPVASPP